MKFSKRIKLTYKYFKSLGKRPKPTKVPQSMSDIKIRPDVFAFLTCPNPVLPSEKEKCTK